jgi:hypothetical protein
MGSYRFFIYLFIITSFITRTLGSEDGIFSRIIVADLFGAMALLTFFIVEAKVLVASRLTSCFVLALCFAVGILGSYFPLKSLFEVIILLFLILIYASIITHFKSEEKLRELILAFAIASLLGSVIGLYDSFIAPYGLPRIFPTRARGEALSGFRNAGQAGAYMFTSVVVLFTFLNSRLFSNCTQRQKTIIRISLFFSILFFITTGKVAAYIGFSVGFVMYLIYKRNFKALIGSAVFVIITTVLILNIERIAPEIYNRLFRKVTTRVLEPLEGKEDNIGTHFIKSNFGGAVEAFSDNPLTASGIGGFLNRYGRHEVHSTYLKIIGETGLLGCLGYVLFMFYFLKIFFVSSRQATNNPYSQFIKEMSPFIIGMIVSWAYTYHLRKREFWILYAMVTITYMLSINYNKLHKDNQNLKLEKD